MDAVELLAEDRAGPAAKTSDPPADLAERREKARAELAVTNPKLHHHLFGDHPKRILALDGGGVLGIMEIAFLEDIEAMLRARYDEPRLVLSDYFDLIGGTSTGAIIATGLALGMTVAQIKALYFEMAGAIFRKPWAGVPYVTPQFDAGLLERELTAVIGERQMHSSDLETGLAIVSKRVDTGSPWVLTNHPASMYWNDGKIVEETGEPEWAGNRYFRLRDVVRASTAAPYYYKPHLIKITERDAPGLFVDGGVTPHNMPALQMLMLANLKGYGFHWPVSRDDVLLISVGSGWMRPRIDPAGLAHRVGLLMAINTLKSMVWDAQVNTLKILQWLSEPRLAWPINSEVGTLEAEFIGHGFGAHQEMLRFQRYDVMLDNHDLQDRFGPAVSKEVRERFKNFMDPRIMDEAYALARQAADVQVDAADFPVSFDAGTRI